MPRPHRRGSPGRTWPGPGGNCFYRVDAGQYGDLVAAHDDRTGSGLAGASPGQSVLLAVRFLTELALVAVLAWAGAGASLALAGRIVLAVAAPVLAMIIWGLWLAPRARRRLRDPLRLAVELVLFPVAAAALAVTGPVVAAVVFAVIAIGVALLLRVVAPGG
jgi:Protein of unknown function (DUF2568)